MQRNILQSTKHHEFKMNVTNNTDEEIKDISVGFYTSDSKEDTEDHPLDLTNEKWYSHIDSLKAHETKTRTVRFPIDKAYLIIYIKSEKGNNWDIYHFNIINLENEPFIEIVNDPIALCNISDNLPQNPQKREITTGNNSKETIKEVVYKGDKIHQEIGIYNRATITNSPTGTEKNYGYYYRYL